MRGLPSILSHFRNEFNKFNNTRARLFSACRCPIVSASLTVVEVPVKTHKQCNNLRLSHGCCNNGPQGFWGSGEWLFIFRDLGSTGNYFRGAGEQAHSFGDLGSPAKKQKK